MNLGERVKKLRKRLGLTQKEFAQRVDGKVDYTYIGTIERGQQYPSLKMLERIGEAFSVPISYFFEDSKERKKGAVNYLDILDWLTSHERVAEATAEKRFKQNKYMMYGYWKAIAVEIRHMKREFTKLSQGGKGFAFQRQKRTNLQK